MSAPRIKVEQNFYVTGGTLRRDAPSYVERQADTELYDGLKKGKFCYVLTARQMGKSSLMVRTAVRLREERIGVAVLDLTAIGQNLSAEQWYGGLLSQVEQQLNLEDEIEDFWQDETRLGPLQRWIQTIREVILPRYAGPVVIFIDEIDSVRSLPFSTDEFFAGIREFYNRRSEEPELERLTFCLLGVATPSDLIRDTRTTPFNIGQRIELRDFTEVEAVPLAYGLRRQEELAAALLRRVFYWTAGHPYLTQRLCQAVAEDTSVNGSDGVDRICAELFFSRRAQERDDNLLFVRERMLRSELDLAGLLSLYTQVHRKKRVRDRETSPLVSILWLSGITRVEDGHLRVRNRIYSTVFDRAWITENLPEAELQRQRAAYRRGLLRAGLVALLIVASIAALALIAVQQRNRADQNLQQANLNADQARRALAEAEMERKRTQAQSERAEQQRRDAVAQRELAEQQRFRAEQQERANRLLLYAAEMKLAQQAWEEANIDRVQKLLARHLPVSGNEDLRGFEWYYLWRLCHGALAEFRQRNGVSWLAFSPDGMSVASVDEGGIVTGWDIARRKEIMSVNARAGSSKFERAVFSRDLSRLATVDFLARDPSKRFAPTERYVRLWDLSTGEGLATFPGAMVDFSPDGRRLATAALSGRIHVWDAATGQKVGDFEEPPVVSSLALSVDGKVATVHASKSVAILTVRDVANGRILLQVNSPITLRATAFSLDGSRVAVGGYRSEDGRVEGTATAWDIVTGQKLFEGKHESITSCVAFSSDGKTLATGHPGVAVVWNLADGRQLNILRGHDGLVTSVAFSADGSLLASGSRDRTVRVWDLAARPDPLALKHQERVLSVSFSTSGTRLAAAGLSAVKLWNMRSFEEVDTLKTRETPVKRVTLRPGQRIVAFSPDGSRLAAGTPDTKVRVWDLTKGRKQFDLEGSDPGSIPSVAFSSDGRQLMTGDWDRTVTLWDLGTGHGVTPTIRRSFPGGSFGYSTDGKRLAVESEGLVTMWNPASGRRLITLGQHRGGFIEFSPDGKLMAIPGFDNTVRIWNVAAAVEFTVLRGHRAVESAAFSPDAQRLATVGDKTVRLWDLRTGQEVLTLTNPAGANSVRFSPDGKMLVIGGLDEVKVWRAVTENEVRAASAK